MRILPTVTPNAEQIPIIGDARAGFRVIRGAAGSGKTTTALLRLKQLSASRLARRLRRGDADPVQVLVLTYNRTLEGYIAELAQSQVTSGPGLVLNVTTFSKWAVGVVGRVNILDRDRVAAYMRPGLDGITSDPALRNFYIDEIEYALGRFEFADIDEYVAKERTGRGASPRVDRLLRRRLIDDVMVPYQQLKASRDEMDWNDLAVRVSAETPDVHYDVVIVDEAQDFSANQVRGLLAHLAPDHSTTFVLDAVQRIYPRYFQWTEVGVDKPLFSRLHTNHRNTAEIAAFARPLVDGLPVEDDGSLPDFSACEESGTKPSVVEGLYSRQMNYMLDELVKVADLSRESVAILQPLGGHWFDYARDALKRRGIPFCELTRQSVWPRGSEQVGLSTIASAKGLEFDHVLIPGLNQEVTPHGIEDDDAALDRLRRLLAMGIGRGRKTVMIGHKPAQASTLISLLDPATFDRIVL